MPFNTRELIDKLDAFQKAEEGAWLFVIGCAPRSVRCPDVTQPEEFERVEPIDYSGDPQGDFDLVLLKEALRLKIEQIDGFVRNLTPERRARLSELEGRLDGQQIRELRAAFGEGSGR